MQTSKLERVHVYLAGKLNFYGIFLLINFLQVGYVMEQVIVASRKVTCSIKVTSRMSSVSGMVV